MDSLKINLYHEYPLKRFNFWNFFHLWIILVIFTRTVKNRKFARLMRWKGKTKKNCWMGCQAEGIKNLKVRNPKYFNYVGSLLCNTSILPLFNLGKRFIFADWRTARRKWETFLLLIAKLFSNFFYCLLFSTFLLSPKHKTDSSWRDAFVVSEMTSSFNEVKVFPGKVF